MRVVIAGGSGLIGTALARSLVAAGDEVVILTRSARKVTTPPGVRAVTWDFAKPGGWTDELAGAGAVVNLAGASIGRWPWTPRRKLALVESRVTATRSIVDAIGALPPAQRPAVLLNASGTDLYEGRDETPASEDTPPGDTFLARLCVTWEAEAGKADALGVRVVVVRQSSVIARGAPYLRIVTLPFRLFAGGRMGSGRQWVSWVDIADVVGLYRFAMASPDIRGPLNASAPDPRQQVAYARALGAALHRPSWFPTPGWLLRLVLADQAALVLGSRRVWPTKALAAGYAFERPVLEDSLADAL
jgi:uncharacterized protein (TIGR01777 family)